MNLLLFRYRQPHSYARDMPRSSRALISRAECVGFACQRGV
jgi:hypothetical protein